MSFDLLGADDLGVDYGALFKTAGGLLEGGGNILQQQQAEKGQTADVEAQLAAVLEADRVFADATVKGILSKNPNYAKAASAAQDKAAVGLPDSAKGQRLIEAVRQLNNARKQKQDVITKARVGAWQKTVDKIQKGTSAEKLALAAQQSEEAKTRESFWTRRVLGPIPGYAVLIGGGAILLTVVGLTVRWIIKRRAT